MFIYECYAFFFFNDTATTEIYTLSLHDALPIYADDLRGDVQDALLTLTLTLTARRTRSSRAPLLPPPGIARCRADRKSTRLNSSHSQISYAVFCLKKKNRRTHYIGNEDKTLLAD